MDQGAGTTSSSGSSTERNSKTEPGSDDYAGVYNFGHNADNPLSTGNGYANALLGVFTSYTERDDRIDREHRHWQSGCYAQDSWRINSRLTLDYGLRVTHHGAIYEVAGHELGVRPGPLGSARKRRRSTSRTACRVACRATRRAPTANRRAINPLTGEIVSQAFAGHHRAGLRRRSPTASSRAGLPQAGRRPAGTTTCRRSRGRRASGWRGTCSATARPRSAPRAGSSTTSSTRASISSAGGPLVSRVRTHPQRDARRHRRRRPRSGTCVESPQQANLPAGSLALARQPDAAGQARAGEELPGERGVPARHRLQHGRRGGVGRQLSGATSGARRPSNNIAVSRTGSRATCSATSRSTRTSCAATTRASGRFAT